MKREPRGTGIVAEVAACLLVATLAVASAAAWSDRIATIDRRLE